MVAPVVPQEIFTVCAVLNVPVPGVMTGLATFVAGTVTVTKVESQPVQPLLVRQYFNLYIPLVMFELKTPAVLVFVPDHNPPAGLPIRLKLPEFCSTD